MPNKDGDMTTREYMDGRRDAGELKGTPLDPDIGLPDEPIHPDAVKAAEEVLANYGYGTLCTQDKARAAAIIASECRLKERDSAIKTLAYFADLYEVDHREAKLREAITKARALLGESTP